MYREYLNLSESLFKFYWQTVDRYENPGPLQFFGESSIIDSVPNTLVLESHDYLSDIKALHTALDSIAEACR